MHISKHTRILLVIAFFAVVFFALFQISSAETDEPDLSEDREPEDTELKPEQEDKNVQISEEIKGSTSGDQTIEGPSEKVEVDTITPPQEVRFYHGPTDSKRVALTFDDGPHPLYTPRILDILKERNIRATFFVIGSQVKRHPELVRRIVDEGHIIANHSWGHPNLTMRSPEGVQKELIDTNVAIAKVTGRIPRLMRPPYGGINARVESQLDELGFKAILWSVDTRDWERLSPSEIVNKVRYQTRPGGIILLHDGGGIREHTVTALPQIISYLEEEGYQLVTVPELLHVPAYHYSPLW